MLTFALCLPSYANQTTYIYGIDNAKKVEGNSKKQFYIRAGSFSDKANAKRYQQGLRSKISYPVKYSYKKPFYLITIGPINSAAHVRETANKILADSKPVPAPKPVVKKALPVKKTVTTPVPKVVSKPTLIKPKEESETSVPIHKKIYKQVAEQAEAIHHAIFKDPEMGKAMDTLSQGKFVFTGGVGEQYPQFNSSIYINNGSDAPPPNDRDLYTTNQNMQPLVLASLAYRMQRDSDWLSAYSLGLQYQHNFSANVGNKVLQYSDPLFYNYNSTWDIASDIFLVVAKLNVFEYGIFSPYVHAGVGLSFNNAGNYNESPTTGVTAVRVNPGFSSYTKTNFAYSLGAGVDFQVTQKIIVSAQYQYQNLGNVKSGNGNAAWSTQSLDLGTYSTNAVVFCVSYLI